jgi:hypothetical protein
MHEEFYIVGQVFVTNPCGPPTVNGNANVSYGSNDAHDDYNLLFPPFSRKQTFASAGGF